MPFAITHDEGILTLTLDTPGCSVNIFNRASAAQLLEVLSILPQGTRAVVFRSAKPHSFINGVGLLMIQAARSRARIREAGSLFLAAYYAVRDCSVPTIAAVRGNCWGCGLEFVLNCKYRIAADTSATSFFMTEVVNYLLYPTFDGVHNLPRQLGLEPAVRLLLRGERWTARQARIEGLCNELAPRRRFDEVVRSFTLRVLCGEVSTCIPAPETARSGATDRATANATRAWIATLPPDYQPVYRNCLHQMEQALEKGTLDEEDRAAVDECVAGSLLSPPGKAAHRYFFIQEIAKHLTSAGVSARCPIVLTGDGPEFEDLTDGLICQVMEGLRVATDFGGWSLVPDGCPSTAVGVSLPLHLTFQPCGVPGGRLLAYNPVWTMTPSFLELIVPPGAEADARLVASTFQQLGYHVAWSRFAADPCSHRLTRAFFRPLVRYVLMGGRAADVNFTLRQFGFIRRPHVLIAHLGVGALAELLTAPGSGGDRSEIEPALRALSDDSFEPGMEDPSLLAALILTLAAAAGEAWSEGAVEHPSLLDMIAREILDFPLAHTSLCSFLTPRRIAETLGSGGEKWAVEADLAAAARFLERNQSYYL